VRTGHIPSAAKRAQSGSHDAPPHHARYQPRMIGAANGWTVGLALISHRQRCARDDDLTFTQICTT
jgi:hypothetical protein